MQYTAKSPKSNTNVGTTLLGGIRHAKHIQRDDTSGPSRDPAALETRYLVNTATAPWGKWVETEANTGTHQNGTWIPKWWPLIKLLEPVDEEALQEILRNWATTQVILTSGDGVEIEFPVA